MSVIDRIAEYSDDLKRWRRHLHARPEIGFECHETARFVTERLREFGVSEIHENIAMSGLVAVIEGRGTGPTIGLRADMDALPMEEATGAEHASQIPGRMHACGHDGHTTMLLGAARYLTETRNFRGRVALIFQPAEESGGGGKVMCDEGIMERFGVREVYALHTSAFLDAGRFATRAGPVMAAVDEFEIHLNGKGGHGAYPHLTCDPVAAALQLGQALQTIVSRNANALDNLVLSVTQISAGATHNVIPSEASVGGTVRSFRREVQEMVRRRMAEICSGIGFAMQVEVDLNYMIDLPPTVNHPRETEFAAEIASEIVGPSQVDTDLPPRMAAEDFAYMLERRPGAFMYIGQGIGPSVHNPAFDFNDEISPLGASYFARIVERAQPLS